MVPFFLFFSMAVLFSFFLRYTNSSLAFLNADNVQIYVKVLVEFSSVVAVTAIAFFLARRINTSEIIAIQVSIAVFITTLLINKFSYPLDFPYGFSLEVLYAPLASTVLLQRLYPYFSLRLPQVTGSRHVYKLLDYVIAFEVVYFIATIAYLVLGYFAKMIFSRVKDLKPDIPDTPAFFLRDLLSQIFWFIGIHGSRMVNALVGKKLLDHEIVKNLTYAEFNRLFVMMGGAGGGLPLLLALFLSAKDKVFKYLARISTPFVIFNINTLLIYPLVVFNSYLLEPFLIVPVLNFIAGYVFVKTVPVHWSNIHSPWITPLAINVYLKTGGDLRAIMFQIFLIVMDVGIYVPYLKRFFRSHSMVSFVQAMKDNLNIHERLEADFGIKSFITEKEIIEATVRLENILPELREENLLIYYQPKVNVKEWICDSFEALLRFRHEGRIVGPFFLGDVERAGLAPILDVWVSRQVKMQILKWKEEGFTPGININIHPDTLLDTGAVDLIINALKGERITIEIVERSFYLGDVALKNLQKLQDSGFSISVDDFGIGYSNLETFIKFTVHEIKIDKTIIDTIESPKGYTTCKKIVELCHEENYTVVAEGVETKEQCKLLREMDIDYIQGFYFAPALPPEKAKAFAERLFYEGNKKC